MGKLHKYQQFDAIFLLLLPSEREREREAPL